MKFIIKDNPVYVIIDDLFPFTTSNNDYAYGRCTDPKEIWCQVYLFLFINFYRSLKKHMQNYMDHSKILTGGLFLMLLVILQVDYLKQFIYKIIKINWKDYGIFCMNIIKWDF